MAVVEEPTLHYNPDARIQVDPVGRERQPVVCIDDFLLGADALRADAIAGGPFDDNTGFYPGLRRPAPRAYYRALQESLPGLIERVFGVGPGQITAAECTYSLVTTLPDDLHPVQRVPHFDSDRPTELAMIHFLCGPEMGGTSFYRHRQTGFEYVDAERRERFLGALEADARRGICHRRAISMGIRISLSVSRPMRRLSTGCCYIAAPVCTRGILRRGLRLQPTQPRVGYRLTRFC